MDFVWISCGFRVDSLVDFVWISCGFSCGFRVDFVWISCGSFYDSMKLKHYQVNMTVMRVNFDIF